MRKNPPSPLKTLGLCLLAGLALTACQPPADLGPMAPAPTGALLINDNFESGVGTWALPSTSTASVSASGADFVSATQSGLFSVSGTAAGTAFYRSFSPEREVNICASFAFKVPAAATGSQVEFVLADSNAIRALIGWDASQPQRLYFKNGAYRYFAGNLLPGWNQCKMCEDRLTRSSWYELNGKRLAYNYEVKDLAPAFQTLGASWFGVYLPVPGFWTVRMDDLKVETTLR
jgi:hypothetical protein